MKPEFFNRLNLIGVLVFLLGFAAILFLIDPFKADPIFIYLFYFVLFFLIFTILNVLNRVLKMPAWCRLLIAATVIAILILQKNF